MGARKWGNSDSAVLIVAQVGKVGRIGSLGGAVLVAWAMSGCGIAVDAPDGSEDGSEGTVPSGPEAEEQNTSPADSTAPSSSTGGAASEEQDAGDETSGDETNGDEPIVQLTIDAVERSCIEEGWVSLGTEVVECYVGESMYDGYGLSFTVDDGEKRLEVYTQAYPSGSDGAYSGTGYVIYADGENGLTDEHCGIIITEKEDIASGRARGTIECSLSSCKLVGTFDLSECAED